MIRLLIKAKYIFQRKGFLEGLQIIFDKLKFKLTKSKSFRSLRFWKNRYSVFLRREKVELQQIIKSSDREIANFAYLPIFSLIMPVYNVDEKWLRLAIESVRNQIYPHWELCIADDASPSPHIKTVLTEYSNLDARIKIVFRENNGNISATSNSALALATGDFIALLDHDDELAPHALFENAKLINRFSDADFIYSDEDKIDIAGNRFEPFFKPDWSPDYFHGCMYVGHLGVYRKSLVQELGGFRSGYDGSQDYDLALRATEKSHNIFHIPKILYHWRTLINSAAFTIDAKSWAFVAAEKALDDMLVNSKHPGKTEPLTNFLGCYRLRRQIAGEPLVSILIPSAGKVINTQQGSICLLENCLKNLKTNCSYRNFEIIIIDGYDIGEAYLTPILSDKDVRLVRCREPFNFSQRINLAASAAKGEFLLLLNDDIEAINPDWLSSMLELSQLPEIGAVGAKLFYPNGKLQHVGVAFPQGLPGHVFHGYDGSHEGYFNSNLINRNYLAVTGACLMIRKEVFDRVGGMDEALPLNFNDIDFCLKLHRAGYRNVFTPFAQLIHYESATRKKSVDAYEIEYLLQKWSGYLQDLGHDPYYNPNFSKFSFHFDLQ
jgi:O-antigen biosynthesis protein